MTWWWIGVGTLSVLFGTTMWSFVRFGDDGAWPRVATSQRSRDDFAALPFKLRYLRRFGVPSMRHQLIAL